MESLKNTFSSTLKNLEDKIRPLVQDKIKVIEQNHENIKLNMQIAFFISSNS